MNDDISQIIIYAIIAMLILTTSIVASYLYALELNNTDNKGSVMVNVVAELQEKVICCYEQGNIN